DPYCLFGREEELRTDGLSVGYVPGPVQSHPHRRILLPNGTVGRPPRRRGGELSVWKPFLPIHRGHRPRRLVWARTRGRGDDQVHTAGLDVTKILGTAPVSPFGPIEDSFVAQYKTNNSGQTPVLYADYTYDAVYLIALAAQKAGSVNGTAIRDQLRPVSMAPG